MSKIPIACTLAGADLPGRLDDWRALLGRAVTRTVDEEGRVRVDFGPGADVGELARLVAAEQQCCAFFAFAITVDQRGVGLEVSAPDEASELVASLFGPG